jgi:hypothetical protein
MVYGFRRTAIYAPDIHVGMINLEFRYTLLR